MKIVKIKRLATDRVSKGYPALEEYDFSDLNGAEEGDIIRMLDPNGKFTAVGYLGEEKRTDGWVLSLEDQAMTDGFFEELFQTAKDFRSAFYSDDQTTAFRVLNAEGDGLGGVTVDYYDGYYVLSWYNSGIYQHREQILKAFTTVFSDFKGIYEKNNFKGAAVKSQFVEGQEAPEPLIIKENGISFATYLNDGWMTGIFLDQRNVRSQLMYEYGAGKTVLNLFSYTGAFSVAAAMGGAEKTVSVDVANRSLEKTKEQFEVNGLDPADHEIRVIDVSSYIDYAKKHQLQFDVVVVDPPTFARTKQGTFSVEDDYQNLIADVLNVLKTGGLLVASTNTWKLSKDDFRQIISNGLDEHGADGYLVEEHSLPADFKTNPAYPESEYLKVFMIQKN